MFAFSRVIDGHPFSRLTAPWTLWRFCAWCFVSPSCCRAPIGASSEACVFQGEQWRTVVVGRVSDSLDPDTAATFAEAEARCATDRLV